MGIPIQYNTNHPPCQTARPSHQEPTLPQWMQQARTHLARRARASPSQTQNSEEINSTRRLLRIWSLARVDLMCPRLWTMQKRQRASMLPSEGEGENSIHQS